MQKSRETNRKFHYQGQLIAEYRSGNGTALKISSEIPPAKLIVILRLLNEHFQKCEQNFALLYNSAENCFHLVEAKGPRRILQRIYFNEPAFIEHT